MGLGLETMYFLKKEHQILQHGGKYMCPILRLLIQENVEILVLDMGNEAYVYRDIVM